MSNRDRIPGDGKDFGRFVLWPYAEEYRDRNLEIYTYGTGPAVMVLHEIFGPTPQLFRFARKLADCGFSVFVPVLFGEPNHVDSDLAYNVKQAFHVCFSGEFSAWSEDRSSDVINWLRKLGKAINDRAQGKGIGVIGLCLTGNFALAMMCDDHLLAPVVAEPALPFFRPSALGLSADEVDAIRGRLRSGGQIAAFRFADDWISPKGRARALETLANDALSHGSSPMCGSLFMSSPCRNAHAVFTNSFDDRPGSSTMEAFGQLVGFLRDRLEQS